MRQTAMKPYTRVGAVALAFFVLSGIGLVVANAYAASTSNALERIDKTVTPNLNTVTDLRDALAAARITFDLLVNTTDNTERATLITTASGYDNTTKRLMAELDRSPLVVPNERELRRQLAEAQAASAPLATDVGLKALSPEGAPRELLYQTIKSFQTTDGVAQKLQDEYLRAQRSSITSTSRDMNLLHEWGIGLGGIALGCISGFALFMYRGSRRDHRVAEQHEAERAQDIRRNEFETRLQRALDLAESEDEVYPVVGEALDKATEANEYSELLLADSSRAHFRKVAASIDDANAGCSVSAPDECPAARRGQPIIFTSSTALDACRHLRNRPGGACSAACDPVRIAGGTLGVVHTTGPDGAPPDPATTQLIDLVTRKTAERIGMLRAFAQAETQARTDALTGLLNRRSMEGEAQRLLTDGTRYVVAYGDLDLFKQVNDVHGHAAGDRALRVAARALRDSVRPSDLVARYGGEEFVIVLPDCDTVTASEVIERVRDRFGRYLEAAAAPQITISFGIASGDRLADFDEVIAKADEALLAAKAAGRDRVIISGDELSTARAVNPDIAQSAG